MPEGLALRKAGPQRQIPLFAASCIIVFAFVRLVTKVGQFFLVNALGACNIAAALYLLYFIEIQKNKLQKLEGIGIIQFTSSYLATLYHHSCSFVTGDLVQLLFSLPKFQHQHSFSVP